MGGSTGSVGIKSLLFASIGGFIRYLLHYECNIIKHLLVQAERPGLASCLNISQWALGSMKERNMNWKPSRWKVLSCAIPPNALNNLSGIHDDPSYSWGSQGQEICPGLLNQNMNLSLSDGQSPQPFISTTLSRGGGALPFYSCHNSNSLFRWLLLEEIKKKRN